MPRPQQAWWVDLLSWSRTFSAILLLLSPRPIFLSEPREENLFLSCAHAVQDEKHKEKLREHREAWETAKKELQSSHEAQIQALEATYQNQVIENGEGVGDAPVTRHGLDVDNVFCYKSGR